VDSVIQPLNNWGLEKKSSLVSISKKKLKQKINLDDFFTCNGRKLGRHFFPELLEGK